MNVESSAAGIRKMASATVVSVNGSRASVTADTINSVRPSSVFTG